ncbi:MAG: fused MFS/spermidine synthase, partial [Chloroflexota bacterium]
MEDSRVSSTYLYIVVFFSGMTTLAVELSASRLLGNVFGTSNLVWANIIGLMLLYLTVGYFIGGRLADRYATHAALYRIIILAAFLSAIVPLISTPVLRAASRAVIGAEAALAIGSFIAVLVLFALPVTLMGMVSPFAIRLSISTVEDAGTVSGRIYALSTLGSLLGTFLPVLVTIPLIGTTRTFLFFAAVLFAVGFVGILLERGYRSSWMLVLPALVVVGLLWTET